MNKELQVIAHIESEFTQKFGIPRQSGLVADATARIVFEREYRDPAAFRGIEEYEYLWLLWGFSQSEGRGYSATVRPPRLGGKKRMGVFATRAPYRPNNIGLSSVRLDHLELSETEGPVLVVKGADLLNGTPIYDVKPYIAYTDAHPDAGGGYAKPGEQELLVDFPEELQQKLPEDLRSTVTELLRQDPRPGYDEDSKREYAMNYGGYDVRFGVEEERLTVTDVCQIRGMT